jgi:hypothetical protein
LLAQHVVVWNAAQQLVVRNAAQQCIKHFYGVRDTTLPLNPEVLLLYDTEKETQTLGNFKLVGLKVHFICINSNVL